MEEALEALGQAKYFSTLDLMSSYGQVDVAEPDRHKTAFSTPMGLFEVLGIRRLLQALHEGLLHLGCSFIPSHLWKPPNEKERGTEASRS